MTHRSQQCIEVRGMRRFLDDIANAPLVSIGPSGLNGEYQTDHAGRSIAEHQSEESPDRWARDLRRSVAPVAITPDDMNGLIVTPPLEQHTSPRS